MKSYAASERLTPLVYYCREGAYSVPGIRYIACCARKYHSYRTDRLETQYEIRMQIEPQVMLCGMKTVQLFCCTPEDIQALQDIFRYYTVPLFRSARLGELSQWKLQRIDYALNVYCPYPSLFLAMCKRADKRHVVLSGDYPSLEKKRKSSKFIIYDKQQEIADTKPIFHSVIDQAEWESYYRESAHMLRIEYQCRSKQLRSMKDQYPELKSRTFPFGFFQEYWGNYYIYREYTRTVGIGDFCKYRNDGLHRINNSTLRNAMKAKLRCTMMLCARARSVASAELQFLTGVTLSDQRRSVAFCGTAETFRKYLYLLESLGMAPVPIPKEWYSSHRVFGSIPNVLTNPIPDEWKDLYLSAPD